MRVRLYEVGESTFGVILRCDHFPVVLGVEEQSGRLTARPEAGVCRIEDAGGQLVFEGLGESPRVLVNGAALASGPLSPGDELSVQGHRYLVSYEQTGVAALSDPRYRLTNA